mgnify:CR=1 FL=1
MKLDPQARAVLDILKQMDGPKLNEVPPEDARQMFSALLDMVELADVPIGKVEDLVLPGPGGDIPVRIYTPVAAASDVLPVLVYYHGGGWVIGDLDTHDALCRTLANESGAKVVAVDYRLAPEHPFPAAVEDAFAAVKWVEANASKIGIDANRIAVAGDSAGGNLAAIVAQQAKAEKAPHIAFQMLIYPATDATMDTPSRREWANGYFLEGELMDWFYAHYLGSRDAADPRVSPLKASSFEGLPPAYVITAGFDVLRDEGRAYAEALKKAGVAVEHVNYDGMIHGFFTMQKAFDEARAAVKTAAGKLRDALA